MTPTIDLLCSHRSICAFIDQAISAEQRETIIAAAQSVSPSSFLQCSSIIRVTDPALRQRLVQLTGGQQWGADAAEFWVFWADFNRHLQICPDAQLGYVDTALMAQNAIVAAESLGLGGIRNSIAQVTELLELLGLPKFMLPLFGSCIGYPASAIPTRCPICRCWPTTTAARRSTTSSATAISTTKLGASRSSVCLLKRRVPLCFTICTSMAGPRANRHEDL